MKYKKNEEQISLLFSLSMNTVTFFLLYNRAWAVWTSERNGSQNAHLWLVMAKHKKIKIKKKNKTMDLVIQKNAGRGVQKIVRNLWKCSLEIRLRHEEVRPSYSVFYKGFWKSPFLNFTIILIFSWISHPTQAVGSPLPPRVPTLAFHLLLAFSFSHHLSQSWEETFP